MIFQMLPISQPSSVQSISMEMPSADLLFPFSQSDAALLDTFEELCLKLDFQLIERQSAFATALKKKKDKGGILKMLGCFSWWHGGQGVTAIKLQIVRKDSAKQISQRKYGRVKGLVGSIKEIDAFINQFRTMVGIPQYSSSLASIFFVPQSAPVAQFPPPVTPFHLQACSIHLVSQIITHQSYGIAPLSTKLMGDFHSLFHNIPQSVSLLPLPIKNVASMIEELLQRVKAVLDAKGQGVDDVRRYARIAVEKYVFQRVQNGLFDIYRLKNIQIEAIFAEKKSKIFKKYTIREMLTEVGLNQKYWSVKKSALQQKLTQKQARIYLLFLSSALLELQKLVFTCSPRQKLKHCTLSYTILKSYYSSLTPQVVLSSMEDIIPVMILLILCSQIGDLRSELDEMADWIGIQIGQMQSEKRLMLNLSQSYNYIVRDWDVDK